MEADETIFVLVTEVLYCPTMKTRYGRENLQLIYPKLKARSETKVPRPDFFCV
jgi:hypothetical protein